MPQAAVGSSRTTIGLIDGTRTVIRNPFRLEVGVWVNRHDGQECIDRELHHAPIVLVRNRASIVTVTGFVSAAGVWRGDPRAANPRTSQRFWHQSAKIRRPDATRQTEADRRAFPIINATPTRRTQLLGSVRPGGSHGPRATASAMRMSDSSAMTDYLRSRSGRVTETTDRESFPAPRRVKSSASRTLIVPELPRSAQSVAAPHIARVGLLAKPMRSPLALTGSVALAIRVSSIVSLSWPSHFLWGFNRGRGAATDSLVLVRGRITWRIWSIFHASDCALDQA